MDNIDLAKYDMRALLNESGKERALFAKFFTGDSVVYFSDNIDVDMLEMAIKAGQFDKKVETK